jgi:hypothetical protein
VAQISLDEIETEDALKAGRSRAVEPAATTTSIGALIDTDFESEFAAPSTQPALPSGEVWDPFGESMAAPPPRAAAQAGDLLDFGAPQQGAPSGMTPTGECVYVALRARLLAHAALCVTDARPSSHPGTPSPSRASVSIDRNMFSRLLEWAHSCLRGFMCRRPREG